MKKILFLIFMTVSMSATVQAAVVDGMTDEVFVENFMNAVFGSDADATLMKWPSPERLPPPRLAVGGEDREVFEKQILLLATESERLTQLGLNFRENADQLVQVIIIVSKNPIYELLNKYKEFGLYFWGNEASYLKAVKNFEARNLNGMSQFATIHEAGKNQGRGGACYVLKVKNKNEIDVQVAVKNLERFFLNFLGFDRSNFEGEPFTILSTGFTDEMIDVESLNWTDFDRKALQLLYSDKLKAGMSREDALPIAKKLVNNWGHKK